MRRTLDIRAQAVIALMTLLPFLPATALAQTTDVVEVTNGDRITGSVSHLQRGRLEFRTAAAGTISIRWTEVVRLTSMQNLDVELVSGERFAGSISSPSAGRLVVQTVTGPSPPIDLPQIVRINPIADGFLGRMTGSLDFGLNVTSASNARNYTLKGEAAHRSRQYDSQLSLDSAMVRQDGASRETRHDLELESRRLLPGRWFAFAMFGGQNDSEMEVNLRLVAGGGIGRFLIRSNRTVLTAEGGLDYDGEWYEGDVTEHSAEVFGKVHWDWFGPGATDVEVGATPFLSLDRKRVRVDATGTLRRNFFWNLYWALNVIEHFDSDPPGDRSRSDFGLSLTLGWSF